MNVATLIADVAALKWQGHKGLFGRNDRWTHPCLPGVTVRHCGHPTALRPYYVTTTDEAGDIAAPLREGTRGRTFPRLDAAQAAVFEALKEAQAS